MLLIRDAKARRCKAELLLFISKTVSFKFGSASVFFQCIICIIFDAPSRAASSAFGYICSFTGLIFDGVAAVMARKSNAADGSRRANKQGNSDEYSADSTLVC